MQLPSGQKARQVSDRMLLFVVFQGASATLMGFGALLVYTQGGAAATVYYTVWMLTTVVVTLSLPFVVGRWFQVSVAQVVRLCFALPAVLLWWADEQPLLLALAGGSCVGAGWAARHWLELSLLHDTQRDAYATRTTVWTVLSSLVTSLLVTLTLTFSSESRQAVYACYALISLLALLLVPARLPVAPPLRLYAPLSVLRQPAFVQSLPLYFLESGMVGVIMVVESSGAMQSLGQASHYGWVVSAATVAGAFSLYALRARRHIGNRAHWLVRAALGMVLAQALLAASTRWPWLFIPHALLLACIQPFWQASEQVLNQRALDLQGALADRIVLREWVLWLFRVPVLLAFWWLVQDWSASQQVLLGVGLLAAGILLECRYALRWLRQA